MLVTVTRNWSDECWSGEGEEGVGVKGVCGEGWEEAWMECSTTVSQDGKHRREEWGVEGEGGDVGGILTLVGEREHHVAFHGKRFDFLHLLQLLTRQTCDDSLGEGHTHNAGT